MDETRTKSFRYNQQVFPALRRGAYLFQHNSGVRKNKAVSYTHLDVYKRQLLFIVPTLMSFAYSITNWSVYNPELRIVGIKNFAQLFSDEKTMAAIGHSIKYAILITVIQNTLAILFAVLLSRKLVMSNILKSIFFLPRCV